MSSLCAKLNIHYSYLVWFAKTIHQWTFFCVIKRKENLIRNGNYIDMIECIIFKDRMILYILMYKLTLDRLVHLLFLVVMTLPSIVSILWPGLWPDSPLWSFVNSLAIARTTLFTKHENSQYKSILISFLTLRFLFNPNKRDSMFVFLFFIFYGQ